MITLQPFTAGEVQDFERDGFLSVDEILHPGQIPELHSSFEDLFHGRFETGIRPDEVNWQYGTGDSSLTRQICNAWKANSTIASIVLHPLLGEAVARLAGWPGVRIMIDNVLWKPPGAKSLGYHQDSAYLQWFAPSDLVTCWIALDDTVASGGTMELVRGSHRWGASQPAGEFHAPVDFQAAMRAAALKQGQEPDIHPVEVAAGGGSFHHGWCWHGSGTNKSGNSRRSLVLHAMRADVEYVPDNFDQGIGPIYSRYRRLGSTEIDENHFPVLWREDGYRTAGLPGA